MSHDGFKCLKCGGSTPHWGIIVCPQCGFCYLLGEDEELKHDTKNNCLHQMFYRKAKEKSRTSKRQVDETRRIPEL